jgi:hypothetical protein
LLLLLLLALGLSCALLPGYGCVGGSNRRGVWLISAPMRCVLVAGICCSLQAEKEESGLLNQAQDSLINVMF